MPLATIEEAARDIRDGKMIIIVDDEDRENEGDLVCAAELVTPEMINFMAVHGRGLICLPLTEERCDELQLLPQTAANTSSMGTAFTISIEAREGVTTGISAADRARTIRTAVDPATRPSDLARPGHVFPLRAKRGGVLVRVGQTEASVDIARIAGLQPAAVICEIMNDDGTMARMPELEVFAEKHKLRIITVADLVRYRVEKELLVQRVVETALQTEFGTFNAAIYRNEINGETHVALAMGEISGTTDPVLVRVQTENVTFAMFGCTLGEAAPAIQGSLKKIAEAGRGVILYLRQRENNLDLVNQLKTYALMRERDIDFQTAKRETGYGNVHDYGIGAQILKDLGVKKIRLLTNHPPKINALEAFELEIVETVSL
ncbi:MAG: 3,4-dihydroxy-2-butanone-4-phosphate synthase [Blastocatellia bacterium]|mgnify:CR=1 FL=1|nr:3,4-dihydroxy-2-butanone-4-phosphate synthase [Chloracidobacterium sp.]MBL8184200.1 3,4-dihydroxy-2-butanone-4-phosphate synthase [Blastocatellia bacterium]HBE83343.1 3,4-dihydroxy-2-butanone-4-phosphate synthase [Blastocatellia bacterium]HRJ89346.1 3,4-dihydroxy-2-butanone-4-phosphate synthase [Pyrinomonadaceae bacterium]HRK48859.1 3,4-dihydroxy-2-butanone-4-phosphate synthase [Pyrinomonadaceae bacterium]